MSSLTEHDRQVFGLIDETQSAVNERPRSKLFKASLCVAEGMVYLLGIYCGNLYLSEQHTVAGIVAGTTLLIAIYRVSGRWMPNEPDPLNPADPDEIHSL